MKNFAYNLLTLMLLVSCGNLFAQEDNLKFSPEKPVSGLPLQIEYNSGNTKLKDQTAIYCAVYLYVNYKWQVVDLPLKKSGDIWKANLSTPANCGFAAFKFFSGKNIDNNNDLAYVTTFSTAEGKPAPGAYAAWALIRSNENRLVNIDYIDHHKFASDTAAFYWLNLELKDNPQAKNVNSVIIAYATAIYHSKLEAYEDQVKNILDFLLNKAKLSEDNILAARDIYINIGKYDKSREMDDLAIATYPKGNMARLHAFRKAMANEDVEQLETAVEKFLSEYPYQPENSLFNINNHLNYDDLYQKLAVYAFVGNKNNAPLRKYLDRFSYYGLLNLYHKAIEIPNGGNRLLEPEQLYPYSKLIVGRMEQIKDQIPELAMYKSPLEWHEIYIQNQSRYVLPTHVNILKNTGHFDEALKYAAEAEKELNYSNAELNEDYAFILQKKGMKDKLQEVIKASMFHNQAGPVILTILKADYIKENKGDDGFDSYLKTLKNASQSESAQRKLETKLLNTTIPAWQMYDTNDKLVSSEELKGKIVVMDLWASWCAPCKEGFPAMKAIVNKYKNDPEVVFLFIDTQEKSDDKYKESAVAYMKKNNYDFHVVFDNPDNGGKYIGQWYHQMGTIGKTGGLPFKVILDKNGIVRYASEENSYSPTELMDVIDHMVSLIKAGK